MRSGGAPPSTRFLSLRVWPGRSAPPPPQRSGASGEGASPPPARTCLPPRRPPPRGPGGPPVGPRPSRRGDAATQQPLPAGTPAPFVARLPAGIGSVEQWADNTDVLADAARRRTLRAVYQAWAVGV